MLGGQRQIFQNVVSPFAVAVWVGGIAVHEIEYSEFVAPTIRNNRPKNPVGEFPEDSDYALGWEDTFRG